MEVVAPVGLPPWPLTLHPITGRGRGCRRRSAGGGSRSTARASGSGRGWAGPAPPGRSPRRCCRSPAALRFDVIDAEFFWPDGVAAMHLAEALGLPFSIKARGSDIHFWGRRPAVAAQMLEAGRKAGGLLAVSAALKSDMAAMGMPEEKIRVHYTGRRPGALPAARPGGRQARVWASTGR